MTKLSVTAGAVSGGSYSLGDNLRCSISRHSWLSGECRERDMLAVFHLFPVPELGAPKIRPRYQKAPCVWVQKLGLAWDG